MGIAPNSRQNNIKPDKARRKKGGAKGAVANVEASTKTTAARSTAAPRANGYLNGKAPKPKTERDARPVKLETVWPPNESDGFAPEFTEEGLSLAFAKKYRSRLRFVKKKHAWMEWTGTHWAEENTLLAYDLIRKECRIAAARAASDERTKGAVTDLCKAKTRSAVETMARTDRLLAATTDQWDADDWLINMPDGTIDLRTGKSIGHDPLKYCTKITAVSAGGDCVLWKSFLDKVTDGDKELQAYLKRMCGYFLTGSIRDHAMFFIYGPGGNGKGVFLNTIAAILSIYHVTSPAETFAEQKGQRHETELARLEGARLVISQETAQGQYWNEARIKSLTGGDRIAARYMRGDYFEFDPKFKLCIVGNHKPQLRAVDDGIRRRFNLIPFDVKISPSEKDPNLSEKLKAEYGSILQWMVEGCLEWQREGLNPPEKVLAATSDYLDNEDTIGLWLADKCITPNSYRNDEVRRRTAKVHLVGSSEATLAMLFKSWKDYAEANNFPAKNNKFLGEQLSERGFEKDRDRRGAFMKGLRLKTLEELAMDEVGEQSVTERDGASISYVYAGAHTHTRETSEIKGSSRSVTEGDTASKIRGLLPETSHPASRASRANGKHSPNGSSKPEGEGQAKGGAQPQGSPQPSKLGDNDHSNFDVGDAEDLPPLPSSLDEYGCGDRRWLDEHPAPAKGHAVNGSGGNRAANSKTLKVAL